MPEGETAIGHEEVRFVEFPELDAETVVLDQEGIAALGAVGHEQEFFAAKLDGLGAANLGQPQSFLLDGQLFVIEHATRQGCQVIRALDGVVAAEKEGKGNGQSLLIALHFCLGNPDVFDLDCFRHCLDVQLILRNAIDQLRLFLGEFIHNCFKSAFQ